MIAKLIVASGKSAGRTIAIKRGKLLIGRAEECDVRPLSEEVSRRHCAVLVGPADVWAEDLGSRNGTFVNGDKISTKTRVRDGDVIRVGSLELRVSCSDPAARAGSDNDVSKWLLTDETSGDSAITAASGDTTQVLPVSATAESTAAGESTVENASSGTHVGKAEVPRGQQPGPQETTSAPVTSPSRPGLLPREPKKKKADSSRDAAAEALKKFFDNR